MGVLVMIVVGVVVFGFGIAMVWLLVARRSKFAAVTEQDFDHSYDELVAEGEVDNANRDAAWRDFQTWQVEDAKERLSWEDPSDE